jgi:hypothetical protein
MFQVDPIGVFLFGHHCRRWYRGLCPVPVIYKCFVGYRDHAQCTVSSSEKFVKQLCAPTFK